MKYLKIWEAYINSKGELKDFHFGQNYDYEKMVTLIELFKSEHGSDYNKRQGWDFFHNQPREHHDGAYVTNTLIEVQKMDDIEDFKDDVDEFINELSDDNQAIEAAKKVGFMVDENGVVYGYDGISCLK